MAATSSCARVCVFVACLCLLFRDPGCGGAQLHGDAWKRAVADNSCKFPELEGAIVDYQTPEKVDSIMKIHASLAETKEVLVRALVGLSWKCFPPRTPCLRGVGLA